MNIQKKGAAKPETSFLTNLNYHNTLKPQKHIWTPPGSELSFCKGSNM